MGIQINPLYEETELDEETGEQLYIQRGATSLMPRYTDTGYDTDAYGYPGGMNQTFRGPFATNEFVYSTYAGVDITAAILLPNTQGPIVLGELQTISYSIHRENTPVRHLGHTNVSGFVKGPRTIAGSMIFTVFNSYAFYKIKEFRNSIKDKGVYPLADMLPPFDIILSFSNEYGMSSNMKIFGVSIIDEGGTMSVDDLLIESTYTYMARGIQPIDAYVPKTVVDEIPDREYPTSPNLIKFG